MNLHCLVTPSVRFYCIFMFVKIYGGNIGSMLPKRNLQIGKRPNFGPMNPKCPMWTHIVCQALGESLEFDQHNWQRSALQVQTNIDPE